MPSHLFVIISIMFLLLLLLLLQEKLEKLLVLFPPEEVEARRWEKIAKALGSRTPQQVSNSLPFKRVSP